MLEEMESSYTPFLRVDVVLDVNEGNAFQERLLHWPRSRMPPASRVTVRVDSHAKAKMDHPFRLAWMHRAHMASKVDSYDWFLSAEADTFVPARAMLAQVALAEKLYERHNAILGFVRLCNDTSGRSFYSDITKPVPRSSVVGAEERGGGCAAGAGSEGGGAHSSHCGPPWGAVGREWTTPQKYVKAMREKAAWGCRYGCGKILTLADDPSLRIYHLGKSGPYLVRVRGHNTLPAERMVV